MQWIADAAGEPPSAAEQRVALAERDLAAASTARRGKPALAAQSVVVVAFPGVMLLDAAEVLEVLAAAGRAVAPAPGYDC